MRRSFTRSSILDFAVGKGDLGLVRKIIKLAKEHEQPRSATPSYAHISTVWEQSDFFHALKLGYYDIAEELIVSTGIGFPLEGRIRLIRGHRFAC